MERNSSIMSHEGHAVLPTFQNFRFYSRRRKKKFQISPSHSSRSILFFLFPYSVVSVLIVKPLPHVSGRWTEKFSLTHWQHTLQILNKIWLLAWNFMWQHHYAYIYGGKYMSVKITTLENWHSIFHYTTYKKVNLEI